jgi:hypothetical protein
MTAPIAPFQRDARAPLIAAARAELGRPAQRTPAPAAARPARAIPARARISTPAAARATRAIVDLSGQQFGRLLVLAHARTSAGRSAWRCRCDCSRETVVQTYALRAGVIRSCGCLRADRARERARTLPTPNLVGEVFGRLTVLARATRAGRPAWRCRCHCSRETVVVTYRLRTGLTQSCGCERPERPEKKAAPSAHSLVGQVFGRLTVLAPAADPPSSLRMWRCRCRCGQETDVLGQSLRRGQTQSCGCLRSERARARMAALWSAVPANRRRPPPLMTLARVARRYIELTGCSVTQAALDLTLARRRTVTPRSLRDALVAPVRSGVGDTPIASHDRQTQGQAQ